MAKTKYHDFTQVGSSNVANKLPLFYPRNTRVLKIRILIPTVLSSQQN